MPVMPGDDRKYAGRWAAMPSKPHYLLSDRLWVRVLPMDDQLASGLVVPQTGKRFTQRGEVLAVGPGRWRPVMTTRDGKRVQACDEHNCLMWRREPMYVKRGDVVIFCPQTGDEWSAGKERYRHIRQRDCLAVYEPDEVPETHQMGARDVL